jgi:radical SAM protein with 4Fe4S-binding SPASM domain
LKQNSEQYVKTISISTADLWKRLNRKLEHVDFELTERCNNACIHCYINLPQNDEDARRKELSTAELMQILQQAADLGCLRVRFTGGEPMLRDDFDELYIFAKKLGMKVIIFTNATLIDEERIQLFRKFAPGLPIEVSVYGMTQETYEAVSRLKGSFKAAFNGIDKLVKAAIPFIVKSSFLPQNKRDVDVFEEWSRKFPGMEKGPSYSLNFDLRTRRDSEEMNDRIQKLRASPEESVNLLARDERDHLKASQDFCSKFTKPPGDKLFSCGAGNKSATIDAYGNVQVCLPVRHPDSTYNLRQGTLEDAIDNFFPKVLAQKAKNSEYLKTCAKCFLKGMCQQCPGRAWGEFGELDRRVPYFCEVTHAEARRLGLLGENERSWEVEEWQQRLDDFVNDKGPQMDADTHK